MTIADGSFASTDDRDEAPSARPSARSSGVGEGADRRLSSAPRTTSFRRNAIVGALSSRARRRALVELVRHQAGSAITTFVDFGAMIALVQFAAVPPALATAASAFLGALVNFSIGRLWIFSASHQRHQHEHDLTGQAWRYALVSLASLLLNASGVFLLHDIAALPYVGGRVVVALAVSLAWNFPMHQRFVFARSDVENDASVGERGSSRVLTSRLHAGRGASEVEPAR